MISFKKKFAFLILLCAVSFCCQKQKQPTQVPWPYPALPPVPPPPPHRAMLAKVVEFGTNQPLSDATISVWLPPTVTTITDLNGRCIFAADSFASLNIDKSGYWMFKQSQFPIAPLTFSPSIPNYDYFSGHFYSCDSFEIKLYPKTFVTLHIKDSSGAGNTVCSVVFLDNSSFNQSGVNYVNYSSNILLRAGIDTVFQYPIFGNTVNNFIIKKSCDEFDEHIIYQQSNMITTAANQTFNIFY